MAERAEQYDEIVQKLSTALFARDMDRDDLVESNVRAALEIARNLATAEAERLISL